jgi:hypothetical protein
MSLRVSGNKIKIIFDQPHQAGHMLEASGSQPGASSAGDKASTVKQAQATKKLFSIPDPLDLVAQVLQADVVL